MRDGVRLSADVYLPASGGPFPTILTRTPYESGRDVFIESGVWWAERGYAFAVQDCRGRFESEGVFHAYLPEIEDGYDTLEWAAAFQPSGWYDAYPGSALRIHEGMRAGAATPRARAQNRTSIPRAGRSFSPRGSSARGIAAG
jgi:hypothetical protein